MQDNLLRGQVPKLLIVGMVGNDAFNGNSKKDPLHFEHFNLSIVMESVFPTVNPCNRISTMVSSYDPT
jgi:hypothetical protein